MFYLILSFICGLSQAAIYHQDNRHSLKNYSNPDFLQKSEAVALIVQKDSLTHVSHQWELKVAKYSAHQKEQDEPLCEDERFRNENLVTGNAATGFLVSDRIMVTAGHVMENQADCDARRIVFGFDESNKTVFNNKEVFRCKTLLASSNHFQEDYAIFELDRSTSRNPLPVGDLTEEATEGVWMMGHPFGLSKKITDQGSVIENTHPFYFSALLDTYPGNSGGPVFSYASGKVVGILIEGESSNITLRGDYPLGCWYSKVYCLPERIHEFVCDSTEFSGAKVSKTSLWSAHLQKVLTTF